MTIKLNQRNHRATILARCTRVIVIVLLACQAVVPLAPAAVYAADPVGPEPGTTNPAAQFTEWPNDEFFYPFPPQQAGEQAFFRKVEIREDFGSVSYTTYTDGIHPDAMVAASGRILTTKYDTVVYAYRNGTNADIAMFHPTTAQAIDTLPNLANRVAGNTDFLAMAAGDLDGMPTADSEYREEVVVVYAQPSADNHLPVTVAVLNFSGASEQAPWPTAVTTGIGSATLDAADFHPFAYPIMPGIYPGDCALAVATGDFDGDGVDEIVVAYLSTPYTVTFDVFRYSVAVGASAAEGSLVRVGSYALDATTIGYPQYNASLALLAADFDGNHQDELAFGASTTMWISAPPPGYSVQSAGIITLRITGSSSVTITKVGGAVLGEYNGYDPMNSMAHSLPITSIQLAAGLFKVDPANGWDIDRRQILAATNQPPNGIAMETVLVNSDLSMNVGAAYTFARSAQHFWLATGGFGDSRTSSNPYWSAAVSTWGGMQYTLSLFQPRDLAVNSKGHINSTVATAPPDGAQLPLVTFDFDGDSMVLGAPMHLTVQNLVSTDYILEEPPKHAYWDPAAKQVANVSRYDDFNITLVNKSGQEFSTNSKDTTDWSIGSSLAASASATVAENSSALIAKESAELSVQASAKVGYDYQQHESSYTSSYADRTVTFTGSTNRDDYIVGRVQTLDIWRYRIFGMQATDPKQSPFYEIVMPGPYKDLNTSAGGLNFDWYQPIHENGNILSYPQFDTIGTFNPPDLGHFSIPCPNAGDKSCNDDGTKTVAGLMLDPMQLFWDGDPNSVALTFSQASGGGTERTYSHTLAESASVKASYKASASFGGPKNNVSASTTLSAEAELHNKNSWGNTTTANNKTSTSTGITLNKRAGSADKAYAFYPVFYTATDGTIRATYAVDPLQSNSGKAWWIDQYGQKPDLALNLPFRFYPATTQYGQATWLPQMSSLRKQMRGFFVYKNEIDPATGDHDYLTGAALDGQKVRLNARVYNYSISQAVPGGVKVRFDIIAYDGSTNKETGTLATIDTATLPKIDPRQMVTATVVWDTTGASLGTAQSYRIHVVLDPDNQVDEKYETEAPATQTWCDAATGVCVDPGQNNEGFGYVTVAKPLLGAPNGHQPAADVSLPHHGLAALDAGDNLVTGTVQAILGRPLQLRLTVQSDTPGNDFSHVLVYDGNPDQGGRLIAGKQVLASSQQPEGSSVWLQWIPDRGGPHQLYAEVLQDTGDPAPSNNSQVLTVQVSGDGTVSFLPLIGR